MKKLKILLLCTLMVLVSGCARVKNSLSGEEYFDLVNKKDYAVTDITKSYDYAKSAFMTKKGDITILFVQGNRKYDIEGVFIDECKNVYGEVGAVKYEQKVLAGDNWTNLTVTTEDKYYYVSWIEDTYMIVKAPITKQTEMKKLINELGY